MMRVVAPIVVVFMLAPVLLFSQSQNHPAARTYADFYRQFIGLSVINQPAARVKHLVIVRDVATFEFQEGSMAFCTPVDGRTCAALFLGKGMLRFTPPSQSERLQLRRFLGVDSVAMPFSLLFLLFADSTERELRRQLSFESSATIAGAEAKHIEYCLKYLSDDGQYLDPDCVRGLLNQDNFFYAHISLEPLEPYFFQINPYSQQAGERVSFGRGYTQINHGIREVITQFPPRATLATSESAVDTTVKITLQTTIQGNLRFSASAAVRYNPGRDNGRLAPYFLYSGLHVDSVFLGSGQRVSFFQGDGNPVLWVQMPPHQDQSVPITIRLYYHGDLLEENEFGWVLIKSADSWFPRPAGLWMAQFDLSYQTPSRFKFVSAGELVSRSDSAEWSYSRWRTRTPTSNVSFNLGWFDEFTSSAPGLPSITVYMAKGGHSRIGQALAAEGVLSGRNMVEQVGNDITSSVTFFQHVFGLCPVSALNATEIPGFHGEAYPGLLHLSWTTYQLTDLYGNEEIFRAHEVAHQWWGIGVGCATYHDQWLSEGFSEYSGLWYMQTIRRDNESFFRTLARWRDLILNNRKYVLGNGQEAGPVSLGPRTHSKETRGDYDLIIYKKGAWVLHMLRNMLIDLKSMNEDRFVSMMREFYETYRGAMASTDDFRRIVEKYTGENMTWFFQQWIDGTDVPTYRFAYRVTSTPEGKYRVRCRIRQEHVEAGFKMYVPLLITFDGDRFARLRVPVTGAVSEFDLPLVPLKPEEVSLNDLQSVLCKVEIESWD
jgi:hypothetical protein